MATEKGLRTEIYEVKMGGANGNNKITPFTDVPNSLKNRLFKGCLLNIEGKTELGNDLVTEAIVNSCIVEFAINKKVVLQLPLRYFIISPDSERMYVPINIENFDEKETKIVLTDTGLFDDTKFFQFYFFF